MIRIVGCAALSILLLSGNSGAAANCADHDDPWLELAVSIRTADLTGFECAARQVDVNDYDPTDLWENTPLHIAARFNQATMAQHLIADGADIDRRNAAGYTPLQLAVRQHANDTAAVLVFSGADLDAADGRNRTALFWAVVEDNLDMVRLLLEQGADTGQVIDLNGRTQSVLDFARTRGDKGMMSLFRELKR